MKISFSRGCRRNTLPCQTAIAAACLCLVMGLPAWAQEAAEVESEAAASMRIASRSPDASVDLRRLRQDEAYAEISKSVQTLQLQSALLRKIVEVVRPSVVHIIADKAANGDGHDASGLYDSDPSPIDEPMGYIEEAGSGVVIELDGQTYVLTNRHVVRDATVEHIHVEFTNGHRTLPTRKWSDESTDVALLEINDSQALPGRLGVDSPIEIGDMVLAIGSPFGLNHSVTHGIISAKGRRDLALGIEDVHIQDFLQTDAAINPGNSGGPLINMRGEVIGLNTAIASNSGGNEGIGFSIPIGIAVHVARQLAQNGSLIRPYLGVRLDNSFDALEAERIGLSRHVGARIHSVTPGSPADSAKLMTGDVILRFNGIDVEDDGHLVSLVGMAKIGSSAEIEVVRDGQSVRSIVKIQPRSPKRPMKSLGDDLSNKAPTEVVTPRFDDEVDFPTNTHELGSDPGGNFGFQEYVTDPVILE